MGILILHGDDTVTSRTALQSQAQQSTTVQRLQVPATNVAQLQAQLGTSGLFDTPKVIILEELLSLGKSLASLLPQLTDLAQTHQLVIWEKKSLTKKALEPFTKLTPAPIIKEFKPAPAVFTWLDSLSPSQNKQKQLLLLQTALTTSDAGLCFAMLQRQIRLLLEVKAGGKPTGHPFVIQKITTQARPFTLEQLQALHHRLLEIDIRQKTSTDYLSLSQELAQLVIAL